MINQYFASDPHFGHKNICKYRTMFSTPEEHDEAMLDSILTPIGKNDTLWLLGDNCFNVESLHYIQKIKDYVGKLRIIMGNHDIDAKYFVGIADTINGFISYKNYWISHAPIHPQEMRNRKGNIFGHLHTDTVDDPRYLCVSMEQLDNWIPRDFNNIKEIFEEQRKQAQG